MTRIPRDELVGRIYEVSHLTGEFLLRSGKTSNEYFDKYRFESDPKLLAAIAEQLAPLVPADTEILAGLEMGGIPIATMLSQVTGIPAVFVRKKAKEYGTREFAEGRDINGKRLLIVEDVVTSGGQIVLSTNDLRGNGAIVSDVVAVIDRQQGGEEALTEADLKFHPLFKMDELKRAAGLN